MGKILIIIGVLSIIVGLLWPFIQKLGLGNLPGDIIVKGKNYKFYFPIVTCIVISVLISVLLWFFRK